MGDFLLKVSGSKNGRQSILKRTGSMDRTAKWMQTTYRKSSEDTLR